ncbi:MAG: glutamate synthase subunit beta [Candidatus Omnitrophica bacterium]|nr:glutamate synthase subunit beta [Candidatus Omnitrophota bacterium]
MKDVKAFLKIKRKQSEYRPVRERIRDFQEVVVLRPSEYTQEQADRCMDCGTPFCHSACPLGNDIPEWNDLVMKGQWEKAYLSLSATNNLPEVTGRLCPALCEFACVLGLGDDPVTIRENELGIIEHAFKHGYVKPNPPKKRTNKKVAVIGSGPAGLACADQLNKAGHNVTVFEKDKKIGAILRYGIPDFKIEKWLLDRRLKIFKQEGIKFVTGVNVGIDLKVSELNNDFDAVCLTGGAHTPRDLNIPGRDLQGIHFAMDFLVQSNKKISGEKFKLNEFIDAKNKNVVIIGGGDTGADCVGVSNRQGAKSIIQIEVMPKPPQSRTEDFPWPKYPMVLKTSSSHEEGGKRHWALLTKEFIGKDGHVTNLQCVEVEFVKDEKTGRNSLKEISNSSFMIEADLVILAVGFVHPVHGGLLSELKVDLDERGNVKTNEQFMTSKKGFFAAGDIRRGQSLIVWAIAEGRKAAHYMDAYLTGKESLLPIK